MGQGPPVTETSLRVVFPLHRVLVLPGVLQSAGSGQVTSVGMLMCAAKQNRCRKIGQRGEEGTEWVVEGIGGRRQLMAVFIDLRSSLMPPCFKILRKAF